jgi:gamma-glutamylputrescine oxidase
MQRTENHPASYYVATAKEMVEYPELVGAERADVCVIGGGFTGVSAALNLAEKGFDVVLLEAERLGFGASGRCGGDGAPLRRGAVTCALGLRGGCERRDSRPRGQA